MGNQLRCAYKGLNNQKYSPPVKTIRDGPISIPNTRYYRYQGLEEKYRILAGNIDCFDTAEAAIFLIVAADS